MHLMYMLVLLSDHVFSQPKVDGFGHQLWELINSAVMHRKDIKI